MKELNFKKIVGFPCEILLKRNSLTNFVTKNDINFKKLSELLRSFNGEAYLGPTQISVKIVWKRALPQMFGKVLNTPL